MNPSSRFGISLVLSLVLWLPTLQSTLHGDTDLLSAAMRYLLAFGFALFSVNGLATLIIGYAAAGPASRQPLPAETGTVDGAPRRRRDDFSDLAQTED